MILAWMLAGTAWCTPPATIVQLRADTEPTAPALARLYARFGVVGPGLGGVRTTTGAATWVADAEGTPVLVTAAHVVAGARRVRVVHEDGQTSLLTPQAICPAAAGDLAVVRTVAPQVPHLAPLAWVGGGSVHLYGFPGDTPLQERTGRITTPAGVVVPGHGTLDLLATDVLVEPGMSGGPAFDDDGALVGVVSAGRRIEAALSGPGLLQPLPRPRDGEALWPVCGASPASITVHVDGEAVPIGATRLGLREGDALDLHALTSSSDTLVLNRQGPVVLTRADGVRAILW